MSTHPESQVGLTEQLKMMFPQPDAPPYEDESLTVLNPERRGLTGGNSSSSVHPASGSGISFSHAAGSPSSAIWHRLFPSSTDDAAGADHFPFDPQGIQVGHFIIEHRIGSGGMGAVFRALDTRLNREVALKILTPGLSRDLAAVKRFQNEARAAARLDHENIARVYFIGEDHGLHYIAFEFITGTNVRELIRARGPLDVAEAVNYTLQIAAALQHTSAHGVVHRDIKPSNIIITPKGRAKLVDLGLARSEKADGSVDLTMAGTTLGTFDYISPEQAKDPRNVDIRSDIYSLGCTLYHMLAGEPPYPEGTMLQKLLDHQRNNSPDPRTKNPRVPPELSMIVRRMMASEMDRRYSSPEQLIKDLMPIAAGYGFRGVSAEGLVWMSQEPHRPGFAQRNLGWMIMTTALLLFVAVLDRYPDFGQGHSRATTGDPTRTAATYLPAADGDGSNNGIDVSADRAPKRKSADGEKQIRGNNSQAAQTDDAVEAEKPAGVEISSGNQADVIRTVSEFLGRKRAGPHDDDTASELQLPPLFETPELAPLTQKNTKPPRATTLTKPAPLSTNDTPNADEDAEVATNSGVSKTPVGDSTPKPSPRPAETAEARTPTPGDKPRPTLESQATPYVIIDAMGTAKKKFGTLEAACQEAADGSVIELQFNGVRSEKPIKINEKTITIRGANGYRPVIEFVPVQIPGQGDQTHMITVANGSMNFFDVNLTMRVDPKVVSDKWALFSLQAFRQMSLQRVLVTIENPDRRNATVCEVLPPPTGNVPNMNMMDKRPPRDPYEFELNHCLVRGTGRLFDVQTTEPGRFSVLHSAVALEGNLLFVRGDQVKGAELQRLELRLEHVTALLGESLVRVESGTQIPLELLPLFVTARNNLFSLGDKQPLVSMEGNMTVSDFQRLFRWTGEKNFHNETAVFWTIHSTQGISERKSFNFDEWLRIGMTIADVGVRNEPILWESDRQNKRFVELRAADFELLDEPQINPARIGAADGSAAGADLLELPSESKDEG
ncbi:MAG: protein kinase [Planctomycetaceae bacterium]